MFKSLFSNKRKVAVGALVVIAFLVVGAYALTQKPEEHPYYAELEKSHEAMMKAAENPHEGMAGMEMTAEDTRPVIAVLLYDGFVLMDAIGPMEALGSLSGYQMVTVAKQKGEIASERGTKVVADKSFDEVTSAYMLVVPGGLFGTIAASKDPETLAWIQAIDKKTTYTTSVCTGAWILGASGVLKGKEASTHWTGKEYLESFGANYTGKRYTVDGKYVTAAGVSAGIDMGLFLVGKIAGDDAAKVAQLTMEYDPQPPYNSGTPQKADPELVKIMDRMMVDHIKFAESM